MGAVQGQVHETGVPSTPGRAWVRRAVAVLMAALWVAWVVPTWQSSLQEVRPHEMVADIEAGRVKGFRAVQDVRAPSRRPWSDTNPEYVQPAADAQGRPTEGPVRQFFYTVGAGRTRFVADAPAGVTDGREIFAALAASGARPFDEATAPTNRDWAAYPGVGFAAAFVLALCAWRPRWGTRPFWVFVAALPLGVGVLAYAVAELATSGSPVPGGSPLQWWQGLGIAVVGGLLFWPLSGLLF